MGRVLRVVLMVLALAVGVLAPAAAAPPARVDVIVVLDQGRDARADAADMSRRYEADVEHLYEHVFAGFSASVPEGRLGALNRDPRVDFVSENRAVHATAESTPTGVARISAPTAHADGDLGGGVTVGILDTGVADHADLVGNLVRGDYGCMGDATDTFDVQGHGTHVAGTVAAVRNNGTGVIGVAPAATIAPVKVLGDDGRGDWGTVACGLEHAAAQGWEVVNLSLSGSGSYDGKSCDATTDALYRAVCGAIAAGVSVVVAAGNDSTDASQRLPASYPEVITVSALEDTNGRADPSTCSGRGWWKSCEDGLASFSNHGSIVDVIAPGVSITSTTLNDTYGAKSGTSMAAPHVAGVAALVIGANSTLTLTPAQVRDHLLATGQCPDTTDAVGGPCAGGAWAGDPDGIAEPLVNAARAVGTLPASGGDGGGESGDNRAPTAGFTSSCEDMTCTFTDRSTDPDADDTLTYAWDFGDGQRSDLASPSHTYVGTGGEYTVTLIVTDNHNLASEPSIATVTVAPPSSNGWGLGVTGQKVKGEKTATLTWTPSAAGTTTVELYVDGTWSSTIPNVSPWEQALGKGGGTHTFRLCATGGTTNCSGTVTVAF